MKVWPKAAGPCMISKGMIGMGVNECIDLVIGGGLFYAIDIMHAMCAVHHRDFISCFW